MVIPGLSRYDILEDGRVIELLTGNEIKSTISVNASGNKYRRVCLKKDDDTRRLFSVLLLVAIAYLPLPDGSTYGDPYPDTYYVAHALDGDNTNTTVTNAEWISRSELSRKHARARRKSVSEASKAMIMDTMSQYDVPVHMTELSYTLQVPYSLIRYSILELIAEGKVRKTNEGFEVI